MMGEKRKAEGHGTECVGAGRHEETSGDGMTFEAVSMDGEEAWDGVRRGWLDRDKVW